MCPCDRHSTHLPGPGLAYWLDEAIQRSVANERDESHVPRPLIDPVDVLRLQRVVHCQDDLAFALGQGEIAEVLLAADVKWAVGLAIDVVAARRRK